MLTKGTIRSACPRSPAPVKDGLTLTSGSIWDKCVDDYEVSEI